MVVNHDNIGRPWTIAYLFLFMILLNQYMIVYTVSFLGQLKLRQVSVINWHFIRSKEAHDIIKPDQLTENSCMFGYVAYFSLKGKQRITFLYLYEISYIQRIVKHFLAWGDHHDSYINCMVLAFMGCGCSVLCRGLLNSWFYWHGSTKKRIKVEFSLKSISSCSKNGWNCSKI